MVSYNTIISFTNPQVRDTAHTAHATGHFDTKIYRLGNGMRILFSTYKTNKTNFAIMKEFL